jgi:hypothetical protein
VFWDVIKIPQINLSHKAIREVTGALQLKAGVEVLFKIGNAVCK